MIALIAATALIVLAVATLIGLTVQRQVRGGSWHRAVSWRVHRSVHRRWGRLASNEAARRQAKEKEVKRRHAIAGMILTLAFTALMMAAHHWRLFW
jgi:hypothetical protein